MNEADAMIAMAPLVRKAAQRVHRRVPSMDLDEMVEEMSPVALQAIRSYQTNKGMKLSTWVYSCVWKRLTSSIRTTAWQRRFTINRGELLDQARPERFDLDKLMNEVSGPARVAIRTAMDKGSKKSTVRFLREEFAWERSLIRKVFEEIAEALG